MLTSGLVLALAAIVVLGGVSLAVWWRLRRCACQREVPLAALGALREVTARARREQTRRSPSSGPSGRHGGIRPLPSTSRPPP